MPTYTNASSVEVYSGEPYYRFAANAATETALYVRDLPTGVTLTSHDPTSSPWELLLSDNSFPTTAIDVAPYKTLIINNETNGVITIEANEDSTNSIRFGPATQSTIENEPSRIGSIIVDSSATGYVYVWGVR